MKRSEKEEYVWQRVSNSAYYRFVNGDAWLIAAVAINTCGNLRKYCRAYQYADGSIEFICFIDKDEAYNF